MKCCAKCKSPYGCARGICVCHADQLLQPDLYGKAVP